MANQESDPEHERRVDAAQTEVIKVVNKLVPKSWQMAMLQIDVSAEGGSESRRITHQLWNPLTDQKVYDFSDPVFATIEALNQLFVQKRRHWKRGLFIFEKAPGNRQEIRTHYLFVEPGIRP